ncbi:hypothetical protein BN7_3474 [Wickerhamomyces ciferrii]|uniref:F-box domain-containing protein n=1 Tax=Wickerhamomyces ciferrii (strain ATCC 14091 / BCRC 22168 / CBS 111 / JCM 3599 / NBRC 0793 / NRRL Y-1031 F-60-10) TaxID=1206466 RepID=K0KRJ5_WICCF|nr:uncharacterized protein BN7_3474 [Wickerhamomyces ciferrii]CCH43919.1 hypothetical protein BN7_3474 [Wickerhamomyces ciferrii]
MDTDYLQMLKNLPLELFLRVLDNLNPIDLEKFIEIIPGLYNQVKDRYKIIYWPPKVNESQFEDVFENLDAAYKNLENIYQFKGLILLNIKEFGKPSRDLLFNFLLEIEPDMKFKAFKLYVNIDNYHWYYEHEGYRVTDVLFRILRIIPNTFQRFSLPGLKRIELESQYWSPEAFECFDFSDDNSSANQQADDEVNFMGGLDSLSLEGDLSSDILDSKIAIFPQQLILKEQSILPPLARNCFQNITELKIDNVDYDTFGFFEVPNLVHLSITTYNAGLFKVSNFKAKSLETLEIETSNYNLALQSKRINSSLQLINIETPKIKKLKMVCGTFHSAHFVTFDTLEEVTIYQFDFKNSTWTAKDMIIDLESLSTESSQHPFNFISKVKRIRVSNTIPIFTNMHFPNLESLTILDKFYGYDIDRNQIHYIPSSVSEIIFTSDSMLNELIHLARPGIKKIQFPDEYTPDKIRIIDLTVLSRSYPDVECLILENCLIKDSNNVKNHNIKKLDISFRGWNTELSLNFEGAVFSQLRKFSLRHPGPFNRKVHQKDYLNLKNFEAPNLKKLVIEDFHIEHHLSTLAFPKLKKLTIDYISSLEIVSSKILKTVHLDYGIKSCNIGKLQFGEFRKSIKFYPPSNIEREPWMNT